MLGANFVQPPADFLTTNLALAAHLRFVSHVILVSLMLVASLIDVDERTIPDSITISGAVAGLVMAAAYPWSLLKPGAGSLPTARPWSSSRWLRPSRGPTG